MNIKPTRSPESADKIAVRQAFERWKNAMANHTHAASEIVSGQLALARGGTAADLSATGSTYHVLKQASAGAVITVGALTAAYISDFDEAFQDAFSTFIQDSVEISWLYDDSHNTISASILNQSVANAKLENMAQSTLKGRAAGAGTGVPTDLTATQATAILNAVVGDSGSGGTKGLAPAPSAGDAAAGKFLKADGTYAVPAGTYSNEDAQDAVGSALTDSSEIDFTYNDGANTISATLINNSIVAARLAATATDKIFGRSTAGAGAGEEIACTSAGRALIDDADASAQRTTLGLGTIATQNANNVSISGGSVTGITDLTVADGGTGASTLTNHGVLLGQGTSAVAATAVGATNTVLHGNTGADPTYSAIVNADITNATIDVTTKLTGTLPTANGGTNKSSAYAVGDVVYASGTTTLAGLAIGNNNEKLILSSGLPAWGYATGYLAKSTGSPYTLLAADVDKLIDVTTGSSSDYAIVLPTAAGRTGTKYHIRKADSGSKKVTMTTTSSQTINGASTQTLNQQYAYITLVSDGSNWVVLDACDRIGGVGTNTLADATSKDLTSFTLTPGEWEISAACWFDTAATSLSLIKFGWGTTTATFLNNYGFDTARMDFASVTGNSYTLTLPTTKKIVTADTTIYVVGYADYNTGSGPVPNYGYNCRRVG